MWIQSKIEKEEEEKKNKINENIEGDEYKIKETNDISLLIN